MKILFSASKEMNLEDCTKTKNDIHFDEVYHNIDFIKSINQEDTLKVFKTKDSQVYDLHQEINLKSKPAINLFNGISFRQIKNKTNQNLNHVIILSALYGASNPFDMISYFRYDYTMKNASKYKKVIYQKINDLLEKEKTILNLASNEFTSLIKHNNIINFSFLIEKNEEFVMQSTISKKMRGLMVNYLIELDDINDLEKIKLFNEEDFKYDQERSAKDHFVFCKQNSL